jgi:hypothetical protein
MMGLVNRKLGYADGVDQKNFFESFDEYCKKIERKGEFIFIMIDEFGKMLEYAAKNNPERELYFLQKFAEFVNHPSRNIILITTLHQNFNSYARKLSAEQKSEWAKVKGRFKEIVFNEPVEQLLYLAASRLDASPHPKTDKGFKNLYEIAIRSKFASESVKYDTTKKLYPLDLFAATALTLSIQRYGQNERTLFTFLEAKGSNSLSEFKATDNHTYSLADVYDYDIYNFYSHLSEPNSDSANWAAIRVALERTESSLPVEMIPDACLLVKTIGMLNLFGSAGAKIDKETLTTYAKYALSIDDATAVLDKLQQFKIIRFAVYKSQYVLFEGTDIDIEDELLKASSVVPKSRDFIDKLRNNFNFRIDTAIASYYRIGTPRYFEYIIDDSPTSLVPTDEIDGYINLIFNPSPKSFEETLEASRNSREAVLFAYFKNADDIVNHIWQLDKLDYILSTVIIDKSDKVAIREIENLIVYERWLLNQSVVDSFFSDSNNVVWIYGGETITLQSKTEYHKLLSIICDEIYPDTPKFINELVNKHKPSGAISLARANYLQALLDHSDEKLLGFPDDKFPPEKTIYLSLLYNTGIHKQVQGVVYELGAPVDMSFAPLWEACEIFFQSSYEKPKKLGELIKTLKSRPIKLKQGVIDFWLPSYLIIKKNDYSLYDSNGTYIPPINKETLEL